MSLLADLRCRVLWRRRCAVSVRSATSAARWRATTLPTKCARRWLRWRRRQQAKFEGVTMQVDGMVVAALVGQSSSGTWRLCPTCAGSQPLTASSVRPTRRCGRFSGTDSQSTSTTLSCAFGALVTHRESDHWAVDAIGAPHIGERTEKQLISAFCEKIAELATQLVTFNDNTFDLPSCAIVP